jgi:imidazoleglycerol phosphate synthase glutamine amidotransferase subunit HisH
MNSKRVIHLTFLAAAAISLLSACGNQAEEQEVTGVGTGIQVTANKPSEGVIVSDVEIKPTMENLAGKPQQFPANYAVPKYPNGQVAFVRIERKLFPGWKNQVMLKSGDRPHYIASYYREMLTKDGWTKTYDYENPAYASTIWQKNEMEVEVRVSPDPDGNENIQLLSGPVQRQARVSPQKINHQP